jgi:hypothetical protein
MFSPDVLELDFTFIAAQPYGRFRRYTFFCLFLQVRASVTSPLFAKINGQER